MEKVQTKTKEHKFLSKGGNEEKEVKVKRRKLWKGGQRKRKSTLKVKAVALTNCPYGSVSAAPQGSVRFLCVCVRERDEYALFSVTRQAASRLPAWPIIAGEDS